MKLTTCFTLISLFITSLLLPQPGHARSSLMITTQRIVLDGRDRSASVHLKNTGDSAGRYKIFFTEKKMVPQGTVQAMQVDEAAPWSAATMVRYSPRRLSLEPRQSQRVRLAIRKPANLPDGEYRSHLTFKGDPNNQADPDNKSQLQFIPTFEFSIPVIIRHGKTFASAELNSPSLITQNQRQWIELTLKRSGNRSLFGDMQVFGLQNPTDDGKLLFEQKGFAHYTPLTERTVRLQIPEGITMNAYPHLKVIFQERAEYGGDQRAELVFAQH